MSEPKQAPRWTVAFLRALERTGQARTAAEDAGIDHTTAYARRRAHAEFAVAWEEALKAHSAAKARAEEAEIAAIRTGRSPSLPAHASSESPSPAEGGGPNGEELVAAGGQMKRAGHGRWSKRKEEIFFEELAATANVTRAAKAAGVSTNAVGARRLKHRVFRAKWEAVVQTAKASINMHLLEETKKSFDPAELDTGDVKPRVTIDQAIKISQSGSSKAQAQAQEQDWDEEDGSTYEEEIDAIRERIVRKLQRMKWLEMPERLAEGWSYDESYDSMIPPGWVKGPHYRPKEPDPVFDFVRRYR